MNLFLGQDISSDFKSSFSYDAKVGKKILKYEGTSEAIFYFNKVKNKLSDYAYWYFLSTLWVSFSGNTNINLWIKLFSSKRPRRETSIMKPSELIKYEQLPDIIEAYRAHRENETNWISYTINPFTAAKFAIHRKSNEIKKYNIKKRDIIALFLRRNEYEIICLDKNKAQYIDTVFIEVEKEK